jgi:hypothetical protein
MITSGLLLPKLVTAMQNTSCASMFRYGLSHEFELIMHKNLDSRNILSGSDNESGEWSAL